MSKVIFETRFSVARMAQDYLALYQRLMAGVRRPLTAGRLRRPAARGWGGTGNARASTGATRRGWAQERRHRGATEHPSSLQWQMPSFTCVESTAGTPWGRS
jgi:hypothetical protein